VSWPRLEPSTSKIQVKSVTIVPTHLALDLSEFDTIMVYIDQNQMIIVNWQYPHTFHKLYLLPTTVRELLNPFKDCRASNGHEHKTTFALNTKTSYSYLATTETLYLTLIQNVGYVTAQAFLYA
jgi:hypothetical protein